MKNDKLGDSLKSYMKEHENDRFGKDKKEVKVKSKMKALKNCCK